MDEDYTDTDSDTRDNYGSSSSDLLLRCSRGGQVNVIEDLLVKRKEKQLDFDINVKGKYKANKGWSALHLASYFGHIKIVKLLLKNGALVNVINDHGDTALHRAAFTSRPDIVLLLLSYDADVSIVNGEGLTAKELARNDEIISMVTAAESNESKRRDQDFLSAVTVGDVDKVKQMLTHPHPPHINASNSFGNSALHISAMRNLSQMAVMLLQEKIDTTLTNNADEQAVDVARDPHMKQLLGVTPVRNIPPFPSTHNGLIHRKRGFLGYKPVWAVLEKGVLSFFRNRGDASTGSRKRGAKYLDDAQVIVDETNFSQFAVKFSNGSNLHFQLDWSPDVALVRQTWVDALNEHSAYSTHYIHQGASLPDSPPPITSVKESIQLARAHERIMEQEVLQLESLMEQFSLNGSSVDSGDVLSLRCQLQHLLTSAKDTCQAFTDTLTVFTQKNEVMNHKMTVEKERSRVLEESIHALASEHHQLERSLSKQRHSPSIGDDDEFFECNDDDGFGNDEAWRNATERRDTNTNNNNCTLDKPNVNLGRATLPKPMFSRSEFSVWSILKQCIGKELSKITMPLIFNEPLSFLQRIAEYMEYSYLLDKAHNCDDIVQRMQYVAAFAVSAISSNWERIGKPFNPLLGETYELNRPDLGYRLVSEQVSHHPPVSAFHVDSSHYKFSGTIQPKLKFWGKSVEVNPRGTMRLELLGHNEVYTWQNVNCGVHNVIVGKLWVEHYGVMDIQNHTTNHRCYLNFKQGGWFGKELHKLDGYIYSPEKKKLKALYGSWIAGLYAVDIDAFESFTESSKKTEVSRNSSNVKAQKVITSASSSRTTTTKCQSAESNDESDISDDLPRTEFAYNLNLNTQVLLWKVTPRPHLSNQYFNFTHFAMMLNELPPGLEARLPPTDVRLRPDIRLMEEGQIDEGAAEKNRMEEKQRTVRKDHKKSKMTYNPMWFDLVHNPFTGKDDWSFNYRYYNSNWSQCPSIF